MEESDVHRRRIAWSLLLVGLALVFTGAAVILHHRYQMAESETTTPPPVVQDSVRLVAALRQITFLLVVLVCVLGVSLLAFRRWSRHFHQRLLRKSASPTPSEDAWAMHRMSEPSSGSDEGSPGTEA